MREQCSPGVPDSPAAARDRVHRLLDVLRSEAGCSRAVRSVAGVTAVQTHAPRRPAEARTPRWPGPATPGGIARTGTRTGRHGVPCQDHPGGTERFAGHDVLLVVSELVTNAMRHGGGLTDFSLRAVTSATGPKGGDGHGQGVPGHAVRVEVADASPQFPQTPADAGPGRIGGHGWALVRKVSSRLEVTLLPSGGKRIAAEVPLD